MTSVSNFLVARSDMKSILIPTHKLFSLSLAAEAIKWSILTAGPPNGYNKVWILAGKPRLLPLSWEPQLTMWLDGSNCSWPGATPEAQGPNRPCCISLMQNMTRPWLLVSLFHLSRCANRANTIIFSHLGSIGTNQAANVRLPRNEEDRWGEGHSGGKVQEFRSLPTGDADVYTRFFQIFRGFSSKFGHSFIVLYHLSFLSLISSNFHDDVPVCP